MKTMWLRVTAVLSYLCLTIYGALFGSLALSLMELMLIGQRAADMIIHQDVLQ